MNILIIEDDRLVRNMLYEMIGASGDHDVSVLTNGHNALSLLADPKHGFDLVFLDLKMPRLGGLAVIETLQSMLKINFVIVTADPTELPKLPSNIRLIVKPFTVDAIERVIAATQQHLQKGTSAKKISKLTQAEKDKRDGIGLLNEF
jgi:DNA-binding NtrC family response regulator